MASRRKHRKSGDTRGHDVAAQSPTNVPGGIWLRAALIVLAGIIAYANSLSGPFVLDDQDTIVMNEQIRQLAPSVVLFPAVELPVAGRPLVNVTFALNYAVGGLAVGGYHAVNIALHIASALLLFGIVRRTLERIAGRPSEVVSMGTASSVPLQRGLSATDLAFATAIIWLVHPLQTDAVDYLTQRTELVMGLFYLLTFYSSIRGYEHNRWLIVAVVSCALGMASKESMVTAPFLVAMYDRIFVFDSFREAWSKRSRFYLSLAATWLVLAMVVWSGPRFRSAGFSAGVSVWTYLLNQTQMIVRYLRLAVWPSGLVVDYGAPRALGPGDVVPHAGLVLGLVALTIWALARWPMVGFLGLWFFTTLSPTSSIVPIATEVGAERRMYLPLAALVVLAVLGVSWLLARLMRMRGLSSERAQLAGAAALAVVVILLGGATIARNREYASAVTLARATLERWPTPRAQHSLGAALVADMQYEEGIRQLTEAVDGDPGARYTLGVALFQQGKLPEAIVQLREFLARESLRIEVPAAHELVGRALRAQGRYAEAGEEFQRVLQMTPSRREVHGLLAESLMRQQKFGEAVGHYQQMLAYRPNDISALMQLGISLIALGRADEAIVQFRRVVELIPRDGVANRNLARALLERGSFDEAALYAREATNLLPNDAVAHDQLGVALANLGRLDEGIAELQRAAQLDPADPEIRSHLAAALQAKENPNRRP
ncbi:MAG TPA: tetratricopeptide repeat protein [Vicinamibacterales bacterium]|nr:tetratricopeptide repeat protein [Vicinamibacterales bacterium]